MHQGGGSGRRENWRRWAAVRQRGMTPFACDTNSCVFAKISHTHAVLSRDAVTMRLPSGLNAAPSTRSAWPLSVSPVGLPVSASHSRAVLSQDAVRMRLPSGLKLALFTPSVWPLSDPPIGLPVSASHRRAVLSLDAVRMRLPSGLN